MDPETHVKQESKKDPNGMKRYLKILYQQQYRRVACYQHSTESIITFQPSETGFQGFEGRARYLFSIPPCLLLNVFYLDSDGDWILMSTDAELLDALSDVPPEGTLCIRLSTTSQPTVELSDQVATSTTSQPLSDQVTSQPTVESDQVTSQPTVELSDQVATFLNEAPFLQQVVDACIAHSIQYDTTQTLSMAQEAFESTLEATRLQTSLDATRTLSADGIKMQYLACLEEAFRKKYGRDDVKRAWSETVQCWFKRLGQDMHAGLERIRHETRSIPYEQYLQTSLDFAAEVAHGVGRLAMNVGEAMHVEAMQDTEPMRMPGSYYDHYPRTHPHSIPLSRCINRVDQLLSRVGDHIYKAFFEETPSPPTFYTRPTWEDVGNVCRSSSPSMEETVLASETVYQECNSSESRVTESAQETLSVVATGNENDASESSLVLLPLESTGNENDASESSLGLLPSESTGKENDASLVTESSLPSESTVLVANVKENDASLVTESPESVQESRSVHSISASLLQHTPTEKDDKEDGCLLPKASEISDDESESVEDDFIVV